MIRLTEDKEEAGALSADFQPTFAVTSEEHDTHQSFKLDIVIFV
jgi:hypothetical protein